MGDTENVLPGVEHVRYGPRPDGIAHAVAPPSAASARRKSSTTRIGSSGASSIA
ncbi:hypothetical protein G3I26_14545 [Streptomyces sp. SID7909]|nr:hypothetical protein [Streptomyces sp. SID7909]